MRARGALAWVFVLALEACESGDAASPSPPPADAGAERQGPTYEEADTGVREPCTPKQSGDASTAPIPSLFAGRTNPTPDAGAEGSVVYRNNCFRCHGQGGVPTGGELNPPPPNFTKGYRPADYVFWRVTKGGKGDPVCSDMPPFEPTLTEAERWQVVAYVQSLGEPDPDAGADASDAGAD